MKITQLEVISAADCRRDESVFDRTSAGGRPIHSAAVDHVDMPSGSRLKCHPFAKYLPDEPQHRHEMVLCIRSR